MKPEISVIMSTYNAMPYLKEAVKSILKQTYKNFEFIVVDDASNDDTWIYLKSLKDKRLALKRNKKNLGLARSLNLALKNSRGKYIARMDPDDISLPGRLEAQVKFLNNHKSISLCGTWAYLIDKDGRTIGFKKYPSANKNIKRSLAWYPPIIHPTFMATREFFNKLKGYNPDFDMAEDYELLIRAKKDFNFYNIRQLLFKWRLWDQRRSRANMKKMDEVDLKVKLESLKINGVGVPIFLALTKRIVSLYLIPHQLKAKISKSLKVA